MVSENGRENPNCIRSASAAGRRTARVTRKPPPESSATVAPPKTATVVKTPFPWRRMLCLLLRHAGGWSHHNARRRLAPTWSGVLE